MCCFIKSFFKQKLYIDYAPKNKTNKNDMKYSILFWSKIANIPQIRSIENLFPNLIS